MDEKFKSKYSATSYFLTQLIRICTFFEIVKQRTNIDFKYNISNDCFECERVLMLYFVMKEVIFDKNQRYVHFLFFYHYVVSRTRYTSRDSVTSHMRCVILPLIVMMICQMCLNLHFVLARSASLFFTCSLQLSLLSPI